MWTAPYCIICILASKLTVSLYREDGMAGGVLSWQERNQRQGMNIFSSSFFISNFLFQFFYSLHTSFYFTPKDGGETARLNKIGSLNLSESESF